ncbi:MAG: VanW family protein [Clostridia bacterium]|nr:VanW family protein [Clostridia bacterium]
MNEQRKTRGGAHVAGKHQSSRAASAPKAAAAKQTAEPKPRPKKKNRGFPAGAVAAALIVVAGIAFGVHTARNLYLDDSIRKGVHMGEVDLSGMDRSQAVTALERVYGADSLNETMDIRVGEATYQLTANEAGLSYDIAKCVDEALAYGHEGGFSQRFRDYWRARTRKVQLELDTTLDRSVLETRVSEMTAKVEQPLSPSSFRYADGVLTLDKGQTGYSLDSAALVKLLEERLRTADFSPVDAPLRQADPQKLDPDAIVAAVTKDVVETSLDLENDPSGKTVLPGEAGVTVDPKAVMAAIADSDRITTVPCTIVEPKYSAAEYKALLFRDVLGEGTTSFNAGNVGRTTNVLLATDNCNGKILLPGDVFSYNETVGPRTYERGFKDAIVYVGTSAEDGVGGGICQVSSTIYYATLRADLKIVERHAHSREVTYVPKGEDATVAWGSKDFRFENDTEFPIKVVTSHTKNTLTVKLYGTKTQNKTVKIDTTILETTPFEVERKLDTSLPPGTEKVDSNGYTGYKTVSYRVVYIDGKEVSRTLENNSTYKKYNKVILYNDAEPAGPAEPTTPVTPPAGPTEPTVPSEPTTPTEPDPTVPVEPAPPVDDDPIELTPEG